MPQVEKTGGGDGVEKNDHPPKNKERSSSRYKTPNKGLKRQIKADKEKSHDLLKGSDVTMRMGNDAQGGSGINTQANTQSPDIIANKLDQMTNLLVQLGPALTEITHIILSLSNFHISFGWL